jgi:hypothetical protein
MCRDAKYCVSTFLKLDEVYHAPFVKKPLTNRNADINLQPLIFCRQNLHIPF